LVACKHIFTVTTANGFVIQAKARCNAHKPDKKLIMPNHIQPWQISTNNHHYPCIIQPCYLFVPRTTYLQEENDFAMENNEHFQLDFSIHSEVIYREFPSKRL
jgi:hypothetical protein